MERRTISYDDKKSKKKKKKKTFSLDTPSSDSKLKSFRKMAKLVKFSQTQSVNIRNSVIEEDMDGNDEVFETEKGEKVEEGRKEAEDEGEKQSLSKPKRPPPPTSVSPVPPSKLESTEPQQQRKKKPPPRPTNIVLQQPETESEQSQQQQQQSNSGPASASSVSSYSNSPHLPSRRNKRQVPQPSNGVSGGGASHHSSHSSKSAPSMDSRHSPCRLTTRSQFSRAYMEADDEFFVINYLHICLCGLWLCVANEGGKVLVFDFSAKPKEHTTGVSLTLFFLVSFSLPLCNRDKDKYLKWLPVDG